MKEVNENRTAWVRLFIIILLILGAVIIKTGEFRPGHGQVSRTGEQAASNLDLVTLDQFVPGLVIDLRYAGNNNFTGQPIYDNNTAMLRRGTAQKLSEAEKEMEGRGYHLKIWDAYRPSRAQFKLWAKMPDSRFLINPYQGFSYHSRGVALDITIIDGNGQEILMPSGFDEFTSRADRDYSDVSPEAARNAVFLENVMIRNGFCSIFYEWWHFVDSQAASYPVVPGDQAALMSQVLPTGTFWIAGE